MQTKLGNDMNHMALVKELVSTYQAFEAYSASHIRDMGLTVTQFDVIATLGNQPPMMCKELGEKTLILKGTMTGVLDRLQAKGLIEKIPNEEDGRSYKIGLTASGKALFDKAFPEHLRHIKQAVGKLSKTEIERTVSALQGLKTVFTQ